MNLLYKYVTDVTKALCRDHDAVQGHGLHKWCQRLHQCRVFTNHRKQGRHRVTSKGKVASSTIKCCCKDWMSMEGGLDTNMLQ